VAGGYAGNQESEGGHPPKSTPEDLVKIEAKLKSGLPDDSAPAAAPAEHTLQRRDQLERLRD